PHEELRMWGVADEHDTASGLPTRSCQNVLYPGDRPAQCALAVELRLVQRLGGLLRQAEPRRGLLRDAQQRHVRSAVTDEVRVRRVPGRGITEWVDGDHAVGDQSSSGLVVDLLGV